MKLLSNKVGSFLTGSAIADAVMALNVALSRRHEIEVVSIPFLDSEGRRSRVQLTVGWQVDLVTQDYASEVEELLDAQTTRTVENRTAMLSDPVSVAFTLDELRDIPWEDDGSLSV